MFALRRFEKVLMVFVLAGVAGAIYAGMLRYEFESAPRTVQIVIDGRELLAVSEASGQSAAEVAQKLKEAGATTLAVNEIGLADLERRGAVIIEQWKENSLLLSFAEEQIAQAVIGTLINKLPGLEMHVVEVQASLFYPQVSACVVVEGDLTGLYEVGLLLDPLQLEAARASGLKRSARFVNSVYAQPRAIAHSLSLAQDVGAWLIIFEKEEILGYDGLVDYTAQQMRRLGLVYGWVELAQQNGEDTMRKAMWERMLRVHSVSDKEMAKLPRDQVAKRLLRATRERKIAVCYTRLFLGPKPDIVAYNVGFIEELAQGLRQAAFRLGEATPVEPFNLPPELIFLVQIGTAAGVALLAGRLLPIGNLGRTLVFIFLLVGLEGLRSELARPLMAQQIWSLLAGLTFPTLGLIFAWHKMVRTGLSTKSKKKDSNKAITEGGFCLRGSAVVVAVGFVIEVSFFSLIGGLFVAGMLTETKFMVGAEQFRGVKLLLICPAFVLFAAMICGLSRPMSRWRDWKITLRQSLRGFAVQPLLVGEAVLLLAALGAAALLLFRSGNVSAIAAPGIELKIREFLEQTLWARPRTKEFLIGIPALFLATAVWRARRRVMPGIGPGQDRTIAALLLAAALGQASITNTFCHLHTPVFFSLVRTANGVLLGLGAGALALLCVMIAKGIFGGDVEDVNIDPKRRR